MKNKMKISVSNTLKGLCLVLLTAGIMASCSSDNSPADNPTPVEKNITYGLATVSGAWPNTTTYLQGFENLDFTTVGNDKAKELTGTASVVSEGKYLYAKPFGAPANLVKYKFDENGLAQEDNKIVVPGANVFSSIHFKSETVAYATVAGGISKLIVFDPTTMRIEDEISLKDITDKFPEATRTYYQDMVERDNKLFMSVYYENNFIPVNDYAYVAIIDLATNKVEKVIEDQRTGMLFGGPTSNAGMIKTTNGDIYIQAKGTSDNGGNAPSGILRIKNGTTEFDADYFFDLNTATGNICYGIYQVNGKTFTTKVEDETDFWEYKTGNPQFKYFEINLESKTSSGAVPGLPTTYGTRNMSITPLNDSEIAMTIATNDENVLYKLNTDSNNLDKVFTSTGGYISGFKNLK
ncbi:DUF4374 domain-containing protein [Flagellimonas pacifica]|uniref:DUF4374 domain-containing protein n=1 Tax=Flagellimonas pacifica TaxID=1247520 RepID=A0A285ME24_9FLAO|nr:DUF4374 domain-containing protein [Allomuricauda parva]SNY95425.1 protein of unknown function [Allomuricauda parva]